MQERRSNDTRLALLEQSFGGMATDISEVKKSQHETKNILDSISIMLAEQRGAGRMAKWAGHAVIAIASAFGGGIVVKASAVAAEHIK